MKRFIAIAVFLLVGKFALSQQMNYTFETHQYAMRDTALYFDLYKPVGVNEPNKTIVYVFGGGFIVGDKRDEDNVSFYKDLVGSGYNVIAIDYRLGLRGVKKVGISNPKPPFEAVRMATEDLTSAIDYTIKNCERLGVDTSKIVLIGSSAGAITVLQMDYQLSNRTEMVAALPSNFRFAGVISMAGAIFSTKGMPKYAQRPAPTFFLHGTADKVVIYKKMQLFNLAMAGSDALVKRFAKEGYDFVLYRYEGSKHEVASFPRSYAYKQILWFIEDVALAKRSIQMDVIIRDKYVLENFKSSVADLSALYQN